jgi:CHASE2 domain-containing sensor protein
MRCPEGRKHSRKFLINAIFSGPQFLYISSLECGQPKVKGKTISKPVVFKSVFGAVLAVLCGLVLWRAPLGESFVNASYDYLFRFGARAVTNNVVLILMDNEAFNQFHQTRGQPWDRELHARLLNRLADDGCAMVMFDSFFHEPRNPAKDDALAAAMKRQKQIVLMAEQAPFIHPSLEGAQPLLPCQPFLAAAKTNWGVAWLDPGVDLVVRRLWPFPSPGPYPSLPEVAAKLAGAHWSKKPQERWMRYYGENGAWTQLSYGYAFTEPKNYFRNKIVFIGTQPQNSLPDGEPDEFRTPYTRWTGESTGGVEIMITSFLNLVNGDWLRRPAPWIECSIFVLSGILLGCGLYRMKLLPACVCAVALAVVIALGAISLSYFTNYWFPWLVVAGGQLPCALAWVAVVKIYDLSKTTSKGAIEKAPKIRGYKLVHPPFGRGAYGRVWLARNAKGQWCALKVIYLANFDNNTNPYEREFNGVSRYHPISDRHPGLLRVDFVSEKLDGYFYYVMELGDSLESDWQREPLKYKPRDLAGERSRLQNHRLPIEECLRIGLALTDVLEFLHQRGLTHRDIKPQNIIFVNGQPKLADLGLISDIRPPDEIKTFVGTPGYLPPPPEPPGTPQADIYALGMVLYVISTGRNAAFFPEIATTLVDSRTPVNFLPLNTVILKACHADPVGRFASAAEMRRALIEVQQVLKIS